MSFTNTSDTIGVQETLDALVADTLTELNQDDITYLRNFALYKKTALTSVNFPNIIDIFNKNINAMSECTNLTNATLDKIENISNSMFYGCTALTTLNFSSAISIGTNAFQNCRNLETVNLPNVNSIGSSCFYGCNKLKNLTLGTITQIPTYAFTSCSSLTSFNFSNIESNGLGSYAFSASGLTEAILTKAIYLTSDVFYNCKKLNLVDIASTSTKPEIRADAFAYANLRHLIIRYTNDVANLINTSALSYTPIACGVGAIYVPASLVDAYKAATNWSDYADQIHSIDEYPITSFGTITDSWEDIFTAENNGTYSTKYNIGDIKSILVNNVPVLMQIAAFDEDNSKITWLCKNIYTTRSAGTLTGGWANSALRSYLINDVLPNIEPIVREHIVAVNKTYYKNSENRNLTSTDSIWIPSGREVNISSSFETQGTQYNELFPNTTSRQKQEITEGAKGWFIRSSGSSSFYGVNSGGGLSIAASTSSFGIVFGFCT